MMNFEKIQWPIIVLIAVMWISLFVTAIFLGRSLKKCPKCEEMDIIHLTNDPKKEKIKAKSDSIFKVEFKKLSKHQQDHYRYLIDSLTPWTNER